MYFCHIENFAYGEINERSFSNPHPWIATITVHRLVYIVVQVRCWHIDLPDTNTIKESVKYECTIASVITETKINYKRLCMPIGQGTMDPSVDIRDNLS